MSAKPILRMHNYHDAFGMTADASLRVESGPMELGVQFIQQGYSLTPHSCRKQSARIKETRGGMKLLYEF